MVSPCMSYFLLQGYPFFLSAIPWRSLRIARLRQAGEALTRVGNTCTLALGVPGTRSYSSREILHLLTQDGWVVVRVRGSHHQLKHPTKPGTITLPHPRTDLDPKTVKSILKHAGLSGPQGGL